jgi:hypothetical protein
MKSIILKEAPGASVPAGTHPAICYRIVLMGTQQSNDFGPRQKFNISWEIPSETIVVEGKPVPMTISRTYTFSMNSKSALRQMFATWRGRDFTKDELAGFDVAAVLGKPCLITVAIGENGKPRVESVAGIVKGMQLPKPHHPLVQYSYEDGRNDVFNALPEWIRKAVESCVEWTTGANPEAPAMEDDKPVF